MSTPTTCCVCGKETNQRCSSCAGAGLSLFFCSMEHQQLVWSVHKLVCGPGKCAPFTAPDLTKPELFALGCVAHHAYLPAGGYSAENLRASNIAQFGTESSTAAQCLEKYFGMPTGAFDKVCPMMNELINAVDNEEARREALGIVRAQTLLAILVSGPRALYWSLSDFTYGSLIRGKTSVWMPNPPAQMLDQIGHRATILNCLVRIATGHAKGSSSNAHKVTKEMIMAAWEALYRPLLPHLVVWLPERAEGFFYNALTPLRFIPDFAKISVDVRMHPANGTVAELQVRFA